MGVGSEVLGVRARHLKAGLLLQAWGMVESRVGSKNEEKKERFLLSFKWAG